MKVLAVIAILFGLCEAGSKLTCDQLKTAGDVDFVVTKYLAKYSGSLVMYSSLGENNVCGIGSFDESNSTFSFKKPNNEILTYKYSAAGDGSWAKQEIKNGVLGDTQFRWVIEANDEKCDGYACFATCNGKKYAAVDCYMNSNKFIENARKAIENLELEGQKQNECKTFPTTTKIC